MTNSRRDYFAGLAMQALISRADLKLIFKSDIMPEFNEYRSRYNEEFTSAEEVMAKLSFQVADAMIQESE